MDTISEKEYRDIARMFPHDWFTITEGFELTACQVGVPGSGKAFLASVYRRVDNPAGVAKSFFVDTDAAASAKYHKDVIGR